MGENEVMDAQTELYGVIGNPVRHSLSPMIHNRAFKRLGWNAVYLAFEVKDVDEALRGVRGLGVRGVSITLPFKTEVLPLLDRVEGLAKKVGAVNTIVNRKGKLIGYNTDCEGALTALEDRVDLEGKRVALLGAGGAARAIGFGLKERGLRLIVVNRSKERGRALGEALRCDYLPMSSLTGMKAGELEADVLINATSLGMHPRDGETPMPKALLRKGMVVMDIVYEPLQTRLLREAKEKGCVTVDGLEMLIRQGIAQFEIWTGTRLEVGKIRKDLCRALSRK
ncbi:MAG TPA: shikimate dehydrogenase [Thermodesulfobacteriota bacterium]|nr:shikimate dehydrogenase [Thermodesulfobacteriota bacterium]